MNSSNKNTVTGIVQNENGISIILVTVSLLFFLVFFLVFIDIAFVHYTRGQLQNAADAAALAGASQITDPNDTNQFDARVEAQTFAQANIVAGAAINLDSDNTNSLSDANDITVGFWDQTARTYTPGATPVNALEARPRRSSSSPEGNLPLTFGKIINAVAVGLNEKAIAQRIARAAAPLSICLDTCSLVIPPGGLMLYWGPEAQHPDNEAIAWTVFDDAAQPTQPDELAEFMCGKSINACGLTVFSNNGVISNAMSELRCALKNPDYDSSKKTCTGPTPGCGNDPGESVIDWKVLVPVFEPAGCPPGDQPYPYDIVSYAEITIDEVFAKGNSNRCACDACTHPDCSGLTGNQPTAIRVTNITCAGCPAKNLFENRVRLVQ